MASHYCSFDCSCCTYRRRQTVDGLDSSQSEGRLQQQQLAPAQDSYMQNRVEALQNVESTIVELSSIFTQLATMVAQQGEVAIRYVMLTNHFCTQNFFWFATLLMRASIKFITFFSIAKLCDVHGSSGYTWFYSWGVLFHQCTVLLHVRNLVNYDSCIDMVVV